jgi:hypothetical protein
MTKPTKPKPIAYELIPRQSDLGRGLYARLDGILERHHEDLWNHGARIALAWAKAWKPDVDGRWILGKCKKATDLDRELAPFDFVILLNREFWQNPRVTDVQRDALLDHECCHGAIVRDQRGEPREDEAGRVVFRIRKHDVEEFRDVVARHGLYKADLVDFARGLAEAQRAIVGGFVGYTTLRDLLRTVGVELALEAIVAWPEKDREDVAIWARMRSQDGAKVNLELGTLPAVVAAALREAGQKIAPAQTAH